MNQLGPTVVHSYDVFDPSHRKISQGGMGLSIRELRPKTRSPMLVMHNGSYVLPEDEDYIPQSSDVVVYFNLPQGGGNVSQEVLGAVLIGIGLIINNFTLWTGGNYLIFAGLGLLVTGLVPIPKSNVPLQSSTSSSPTYNLNLAGNSARIGQSIPVIYGRHIILPDFAAQPYTEYDSNGDQYYYALMCLGELTTGQFTIESLMIDDTDLSHFVDVQYSIASQFSPVDFLGPTSLPPSIVNPAVVTNSAVANNVFDFGTIVGPFAASGPGLLTKYIGIDIICPKGLYFAADDGSLQPVKVTWMVEARTIDDYNVPTGIWTLLGSESLTGASSTPIRRSFKYPVASARYEVRAQRLEAENTDSRYGDTLQWGGLRAYLDISAPLETSAQYLQLRIKADSQLSGLSQRQITLIIQRWLPTWNPTTGWGPPVYTRSPAWAAADVLRSTDYGGKVPDSRIDLQTLYELDQVWAARGDTCNLIFDSRVTIWSALQSILQTGRAQPIMRGSVFTFVRDSQQDLPTALFNMRNIVSGTFNISYNMVSEDTADGIEIAYFNEQTWSTDYVSMPMPGVDETLQPAQISIVGITNKLQAQRECAYMIADSAYRRTSVSFDTELEGYLPCFGDLIAVSHDVASWGQSGDFEDWDGTTAIVTENITWTNGSNYMILINSQGDVQGPFLVTPGATERSITFPSGISVDLIYTGTDRERTRYAVGPGTAYAMMCRVISLTPGDGTVTVNCVVEDNRVHSADLPYAGAGSIGGGGGGGGSGGSGGSSIPGGGKTFVYAPDNLPGYDAASDAQRQLYGYYADVDLTVGTSKDPGYIYANT